MESAHSEGIFSDGILTLSITGEIDHHSALELREEMDRELFFYRPMKLIILLSGITFMDSSGLGLILGRYRKAKDLGSDFAIQDPTSEIMRILSLAGADKFIKIERSEDELSEKTKGKEKISEARENEAWQIKGRARLNKKKNAVGSERMKISERSERCERAEKAERKEEK